MAWIEPKTDWVKTDFFNYGDYNRMIGNLLVLKEMSDELFVDILFEDMGLEKVENDVIYASEFNKIENNLYNIAKWSYGENTKRRTYRSNGGTPTFEDFNRLERMMLLLYNKMRNHKDNLYRLPFILGNQKGVRV